MFKTELFYNRFYFWLAKNIVFMLIILALLITPYQLSLVSATSYYLFHPGFGTPVIDGNVEISEWAAADTYTQVMYGSNTDLTGSLYVLQDKENIYLGFIIDDDELTIGDWYGLLGDTLEIDFDDNNSGELFEEGENRVTIDAVTPYRDAHFVNTSGSSDEDAQQDGQGYLARQGNNNHFELAFPLCSGDADDFCLAGGSVLGLQITYDDYDANTAEPSPTPDASTLPGQEDYELVTIEILTIYDIFLPLISK